MVTYNKKQYIIELKKWYGQAYTEKGYEQLAKYLEIKREREGYMVIFDFRKTKKEYHRGWIERRERKIYEVTV